MRYLTPTLGLVLLLSAAPAFAQMSMGGAGGGAPGGGAPQPQARVPDIAPPALPGAGAPPPLATGPVMQKPMIGNPTQALFAAVNSGDYNAAQDAISRGADLTAQDELGETPLDLSVALNRSSITFLLLATRNETGGEQPIAPGPAFSALAPVTPHPGHERLHIVRASEVAPAVVGNNPGTPDPSAGFLGFGPKS